MKRFYFYLFLAVIPLLSFQNCVDSDGDGVRNVFDNCVYGSNKSQEDIDNNGIGDICEPTSWNYTFFKGSSSQRGGGANIGHSLVNMPDGGYAFLTTIFSNYQTGYDQWLVKTDREGVKEWDRVFDQAGSAYEGDVILSSDAMLAVTGGIYEASGTVKDIYLAKLDLSGNTVWETSVGTPGVWETGEHLIEAHDYGLLLVGHIEILGYTNVVVVKTGANGVPFWSNNFGSSTGNYYSLAVVETFDRGYVIIGWRDHYPDDYHKKIWLLKIDRNGEFVWEHEFGDEELHAQGRSLVETFDGGLLLLGTHQDASYSNQMWLIRTGSNGELVWEKKLGTNEKAGWIASTFDGGYIITGSKQEPNTSESVATNLVLRKLDAEANEEWAKFYDGDNDGGWGSYDDGRVVRQDFDEGFIVTGSYDYITGTLKTNPSGEVTSHATYQGD